MVYQVKENSYGHLKRVDWFSERISRADSICEIGCGTGAMILLPLAQRGYNIAGFDLDEESINFGKQLLKKEKIEAELYATEAFVQSEEQYDVIIVSEVMEHITNPEYPPFFELIQKKLKPNGKLLVTVPNGYGWFELESFLYHKVKLGKVLEKLKIVNKIDQFKNYLFKRSDWVNTIPSTLSSTPHVQRFTHTSIQKLLKSFGYQVESITGSVLFTGPLTDRIFSGFQKPLRANNFLGSFFPKVASGFFVECIKKPVD